MKNMCLNFYKLLRSYISFFVVMSFVACNKPVTLEVPYPENKIVLNSLIAKDSIIFARVTETSRTNEFPEIANAEVNLYQNDVFLEKLSPTMINSYLYFVSKSKAVSKNKYTLKASAPGKDNVEGSDIIPSKPICSAISFKQINSKHKVQIKLIDNPDEPNFYRLRVFEANKNNMNMVEVDKSFVQYFTVDNLDLDNLGVFSTVENGVSLFNDEKFNGKEIVLNITLDNYDEENTHIAIELEGITTHTFQYLKSKDLGENNGIADPFSEGIIVYNNIEGGYGIVGGIAKKLLVIKKQ